MAAAEAQCRLADLRGLAREQGDCAEIIDVAAVQWRATFTHNERHGSALAVKSAIIASPAAPLACLPVVG